MYDAIISHFKVAMPTDKKTFYKIFKFFLKNVKKFFFFFKNIFGNVENNCL